MMRLQTQPAPPDPAGGAVSRVPVAKHHRPPPDTPGDHAPHRRDVPTTPVVMGVIDEPQLGLPTVAAVDPQTAGEARLVITAGVPRRQVSRVSAHQKFLRGS